MDASDIFCEASKALMLKSQDVVKHSSFVAGTAADSNSSNRLGRASINFANVVKSRKYGF